MTNRMEWQPMPVILTDEIRHATWRSLYKARGASDEDADAGAKARVADAEQRELDNIAYQAMLVAGHPRPTTPVVDEGGESEREASGVEPDSGLHMPGEEDEPLGYRIARKAYEETGGPTQGLKDLYKAYLDNEKRVEAKQATRISELEAEVERLKEDVSRQMAIANSECARAEKAEEAQQVLHATLMRVETEKVNAQLALSDEVYRRQMAECELAGERAAYLFIASKSRKEVVADAIRARSAAMNRGWE